LQADANGYGNMFAKRLRMPKKEGAAYLAAPSFLSVFTET